MSDPFRPATIAQALTERLQAHFRALEVEKFQPHRSAPIDLTDHECLELIHALSASRVAPESALTVNVCVKAADAYVNAAFNAVHQDETREQATKRAAEAMRAVLVEALSSQPSAELEGAKLIGTCVYGPDGTDRFERAREPRSTTSCCPDCSGTGSTPTMACCRRCGGGGQVPVPVSPPPPKPETPDADHKCPPAGPTTCSECHAPLTICGACGWEQR